MPHWSRSAVGPMPGAQTLDASTLFEVPAKSVAQEDMALMMPRLSAEQYAALVSRARGSPPPYPAPAPRRAKVEDTESSEPEASSASERGFERSEDGWVTVAAKGKKAPRSPKARAKEPSAPRPKPGPLHHHQLPVALGDHPQVRVVRRLLGQGGENMKRITAQCPGTWVELRGAGTNLGRGSDTGPLVLHVKGHDAVACGRAVELANALIGETAESPAPSGLAPRAPRGAPEPFVHRELAVGLEETAEFRVARRLIGPGGENVKFIAHECPGTRLELRGEGANPWNGLQSGPLVLHIRARDAATADAALKLASELVEHVKEERAAALAGEEGEERGGKGAKGRGKGKFAARGFRAGLGDS